MWGGVEQAEATTADFVIDFLTRRGSCVEAESLATYAAAEPDPGAGPGFRGDRGPGSEIVAGLYEVGEVRGVRRKGRSRKSSVWPLLPYVSPD